MAKLHEYVTLNIIHKCNKHTCTQTCNHIYIYIINIVTYNYICIKECIRKQKRFQTRWRGLNQRMDSSSVSQLLGAGAVGGCCACWERSPRVFNNSPGRWNWWNFMRHAELWTRISCNSCNISLRYYLHYAIFIPKLCYSVVCKLQFLVIGELDNCQPWTLTVNPYNRWIARWCPELRQKLFDSLTTDVFLSFNTLKEWILHFLEVFLSWAHNNFQRWTLHCFWRILIVSHIQSPWSYCYRVVPTI